MLLAEVLRSQGDLSDASQVMLIVCEAYDVEPSLCLRAPGFTQQSDRRAITAQICQARLHEARCRLSCWCWRATAHANRMTSTLGARYIAALDAGIDLHRHHLLGRWLTLGLSMWTTPISRDSRNTCRYEMFAAVARFGGLALGNVQNNFALYSRHRRRFERRVWHRHGVQRRGENSSPRALAGDSRIHRRTAIFLPMKARPCNRPASGRRASRSIQLW